eukprot:2434735-Rhodomonas_salina.4
MMSCEVTVSKEVRCAESAKDASALRPLSSGDDDPQGLARHVLTPRAQALSLSLSLQVRVKPQVTIVDAGVKLE